MKMHRFSDFPNCRYHAWTMKLATLPDGRPFYKCSVRGCPVVYAAPQQFEGTYVQKRAKKRGHEYLSNLESL